MDNYQTEGLRQSNNQTENVLPASNDNVMGIAAEAKCPNIPFMPKEPKLAFAYVPYQVTNNTYTAEEGLDKGTIFPCLYRPYKKETTPNTNVKYNNGGDFYG